MHAMRRSVAALLAAGLVLAFAPLSSAGAQVAGGGPLRTGENFRLGSEPGVARGRDVPGLAVNPANPDHIVEVDVDYVNGECDFHTSLDGGKSWTGGRLRGPAGFSPVPPCEQNFDSGGYAHGNASVIFGSGQNVYTTFSSHRGPFQRPESSIIAGAGDDSLVARSTDGGRSFQEATVGIRGGPDPQPFFIRPQLAVEPGAGTGGADRVYVNAWACRVTTGGCSGGKDIRKMIVARSDDGGVTWGAPVEANRPNEEMREPSQPVVAADGSVYIAWRNRDTVLPTTAPQPPNFITVARSVDRGATWTHVDVNSSTGGGGHPRLAVDRRNGTLYVAYLGTDFSGGAEVDIVFQRSTDRGQTWSAPSRVNDDAVGNRLDQRNPWVSVGPDGKVNVVWMDPRHANNATSLLSCCPGRTPSRGLGDIYTATSTNGGVSFEANRRVTDRSFNRDVGLVGVGGYTWYGAVSTFLDANRIMFAWTDMREGNFNNGAQDIYLATEDLRSGGTIPVKRLPLNSTTGLSAAISRLAYPGGLEAASNPPVAVSKVVIVPEGDAALALAGSVLARGNFGPLLASPAARLSEEVRAEVRRMEPIGAFVLGGESALTAGVVDDLVGAGIPRREVVRIAGATNADTARLIATAMDNRTDEVKAAGTPAFDGALIVNPASPEASGVATLAASARLAVLFTDGAGSLPAATTTALRDLGVPSTAVVGGTGSVTDAAVAQLPGFAGRLAGGDAAAVSESATAQLVARGFPTNQVFVGDSNRPVDAAVLGAAVARIGGLSLLVPGADVALADAALSRLGLKAGVDAITVAVSTGLGGAGYRLVAADGGVFAFGSRFLGSLGGKRLNRPVVASATTPTGDGYYLVASDGGVFSFGDAVFRGSTGALRLNKPIVGMAVTPTGKGYWLVASDGGVFAFGDAVFLGSTGAVRLNQPMVAMAATPTGKGYVLIARDGGVFAFGDAVFKGSTGATRLNQPIVGAAGTPSGQGYFLVASDGGVFAFGDAVFRGSTGAIRLARPVVGMAATLSGRGYALAASDGGVFAFGDAAFRGSAGSTRLASPIVNISAG